MQKLCVLVATGMAAVLMAGCATYEKGGKSISVSAKREGTKVWIDYAVDIHEHPLSGLSHICRIADVLRYYGKDVDTDWLMGVSGEAFAYYYHPDGTFLTPFVHSWDSALAALEAYGYSGEWITSERGSSVEASLRAIESEINASRLVLAPGIKASKNAINSRCHYWFIVNGVDMQEQEVSLVGSHNRAANFIPLPKGDSPDPREHPRWYGILRTGDQHYGDNPLLLVKPGGRERNRRALVLRTLERMSRTGREPVELKRYGGGTYLAGVLALERLLGDIEAAKGDGIEEFKRLNPTRGDPFGGAHEELLHLRLLAERRRAAAAFLRKAAVHLLEGTRSHINAAAAKYDEVSRFALDAFELRHGSVEENDRICEMAREERFGEDVKEWLAYWRRADANLADVDKRRDLASLIRSALEAEREAIAELEKVLTLLR